MSKLEETRDKLQASLGNREKQLTVAQNSYKNNRKRAYQYHNRAERAAKLSDRERRFKGVGKEADRHLDRAEHYTREQNRFGSVAYRNHVRAQEALGKTKRLTRKIHGIELDLKEVNERLSKVTIKGDKAYGGSDWDRWMAVTLRSVYNCERGIRANWYSMGGVWNCSHVITGYNWGTRDDCSSTVYGWIKAAQLPDPQGNEFRGGYTGTLAYPHANSGWKEVSLEKFLATDAPGYIIYGSGDGHHTEAKCPSPTDKYRTAGHGSAPVDFGTTFLFGSNEYQRYYLYLP